MPLAQYSANNGELGAAFPSRWCICDTLQKRSVAADWHLAWDSLPTCSSPFLQNSYSKQRLSLLPSASLCASRATQ